MRFEFYCEAILRDKLVVKVAQISESKPTNSCPAYTDITARLGSGFRYRSDIALLDSGLPSFLGVPENSALKLSILLSSVPTDG